MEKSIKVYKPSLRYSLINGSVLFALIFFLLTLPTLTDGIPLERNKFIGLLGFWLVGVIIVLAPIGFRMEVESGHVRTYFLGFCLRDLQPPNIRVLEYGNLFRGGLGIGKGLKGWEKTRRGNNKYFSIGEKFWGKDALEHARRVLEDKF